VTKKFRKALKTTTPESAPTVAAPVRPESAPAKSAPPDPPAAPPAVVAPLFTVGREAERDALLRNVAQGFPTALLGRPGIGKSHLLRDLHARLVAQGRPVVYAEMISARETGRAIYESLCRLAHVEPRHWKGGITVAESLTQIEEVLDRFKPKEVVLLLDGAEHAPIRAEAQLRMLSEKTVVVAAALYVRRSKRIQRFFWQFEKIDVKPLGQADARRLAEHTLKLLGGIKVVEEDPDWTTRFLRRVPLIRNRLIPTREYLLNRVVTESAGIPLAIVETIQRLKGADRIDIGFVRGMFIHEAREQFIDGAPVILTFLVTLMILKFVNRGMYRFDMYAIFGGIGALGILIRYFMLRGSRDTA